MLSCLKADIKEEKANRAKIIAARRTRMIEMHKAYNVTMIDLTESDEEAAIKGYFYYQLLL